jgi:lipopolysaccharide transport system permease protein
MTSKPTPWRHRALVLELVKREFSGRYRGSFGGLAWSFAQPLFLLAVYTVAFGLVLRATWGFPGGTADFALMVFAGLIVFNAVAECLERAPRLIAGNPNYVRKVVFPLETLAWVMALTALLHAAIAVAIWVAGYALLVGMPRATAPLALLVLLALFPLLLGIGWLVSALGVFARDIAQVTTLVSHALLFLTPIFYAVEAVPEAWRAPLHANPLTFVVESLRRVLYLGEPPAWAGLAAYFALATAFAAGSLAVFRRLRPRFADLV